MCIHEFSNTHMIVIRKLKSKNDSIILVILLLHVTAGDKQWVIT